MFNQSLLTAALAFRVTDTGLTSPCESDIASWWEAYMHDAVHYYTRQDASHTGETVVQWIEALLRGTCTLDTLPSQYATAIHTAIGMILPSVWVELVDAYRFYDDIIVGMY